MYVLLDVQGGGGGGAQTRVKITSGASVSECTCEIRCDYMRTAQVTEYHTLSHMHNTE